MVKKTTIDAALKLLRAKGDTVSLAQAEVLTNRLNERSVFDQYVAHVSEADRDETLYYACRDAARFLYGGLTMEELIPDASDVEADIPANDDEPDTITLSRKEFNALLARIEKLERWTGLKRKPAPVRLPALPSTANPMDYVTQNEAARMLGIGKRSMRGYVDRGEIKAWQNGKFVVYRRQDIEKLKGQKTKIAQES